MGSSPKKEENDTEQEEIKSEEWVAKPMRISDDMVRLVTTIAILAAAKGDEQEEKEREEERGDWEFRVMLAAFAIFMVLLTVFVQWLWKVGVRWQRVRIFRLQRPEVTLKLLERKREEGMVRAGWARAQSSPHRDR